MQIGALEENYRNCEQAFPSSIRGVFGALRPLVIGYLFKFSVRADIFVARINFREKMEVAGH